MSKYVFKFFNLKLCCTSCTMFQSQTMLDKLYNVIKSNYVANVVQCFQYHLCCKVSNSSKLQGLFSSSSTVHDHINSKQNVETECMWANYTLNHAKQHSCLTSETTHTSSHQKLKQNLGDDIKSESNVLVVMKKWN